MKEEKITIDTAIIEACKIKDVDFRIKMVTKLLKLKDSGNKMDSLLSRIKHNQKNDEDWLDIFL